MGFPGHFKIPGHSGTDFKHRKAFSKVKAYQKTRKSVRKHIASSKFGDPGIVSQLQEARTSKANTFATYLSIGSKLFFALALLTTFVLGMNWVLNRPISISPEPENLAFKKELRDAYHVLVTTGNNFLLGGSLDEAQSEFVRAIKIDEYGELARIGLTKVLAKKCELYNEFCEEAVQQKDFLKEMGYLSEEEQHEF